MNLFGTAGVRGPVPGRIGSELVLNIARSAAVDGPYFVVGWDGRETSQGLATAAIAGLLSGGADVLRLGTVPTPTVAFASQSRRGIMITASHNPPTDNGVKLFVDGVEYDRAAERRIESRVVASQEDRNWDRWGRVRNHDVIPQYRDSVVDYARMHGESIKGYRIVVDCGNGMASLVLPSVLHTLGADVIALNANVDGHFPGRDSKPTAKSLTDMCSFVAGDDADVGIALDGDADRVVIVDSNGDVIHEDTVVAMLAEHFTAASKAADPVVITTPNASERIDERVEAAGGRVERVRLGGLHEGIGAANHSGEETTQVVFAAEPWKHIHIDFGTWIDGIASAAVFSRMVAASGDVETLRTSVTELPYRKTSIPCPDGMKEPAMTIIESELRDRFTDAEFSTTYGVRLTWRDGSWVLIRPSGTEPCVRVYVESKTVDPLLDDVRTVVEAAIDAARSS